MLWNIEMLIKYLQEAIKLAQYEVLEDDGAIYAEIPDFQGVYAKAETFEECRNLLIEILEELIFIRLRRNLYITIIENIYLNILDAVDAAY